MLTLAPAGAERSGNPWHVHEYRAGGVPRRCASATSAQVDLLGLFHARKLRAHQWAIEHAGWDAIHGRLGFTKPFYDRFTPAISVRDFALRRRGTSTARSTSSPSCARSGAGDGCDRRSARYGPALHKNRPCRVPSGRTGRERGTHAGRTRLHGANRRHERGVAQFLARARQLTP